MSATVMNAIDRKNLTDLEVALLDARSQAELIFRFVAGPGIPFPARLWTHAELLRHFVSLPDDADLFRNVAADCGVDLESIPPELQRAALAELRELKRESRLSPTAHLITALEANDELDADDRKTLDVIRSAHAA